MLYWKKPHSKILQPAPPYFIDSINWITLSQAQTTSQMVLKATVCTIFIIKYPKTTCTVWNLSCSCVLVIPKVPKDLQIINNGSSVVIAAYQWRNIHISSVSAFRNYGNTQTQDCCTVKLNPLRLLWIKCKLNKVLTAALHLDLLSVAPWFLTRFYSVAHYK